MWWFRRRRGRRDDRPKRSIAMSSSSSSGDYKLACYSYTDLQSATENFSPEKKIDEGQFGELYKGELSDGTKFAVKKLSSKYHKEDHSVFASDVSSIFAVEHPNLVKLMGCCIEADEQFLLYEFLENGRPLSRLLFNPDNGECLSWQTRMTIAIGIARGVNYLHEEAHVIHGDIQASNIIIDENFTPKISDFGLTSLLPDEDSYINSRFSGTLGYIAPEVAQGKLTDKADVFSFGVLLLEIVSGRNNFEPDLPMETVFLVQWTWKLYEQGKVLELVDPLLNNDFPEEEVFRAIHIALLCTQDSVKSRPHMVQVRAMLTGDWEISVFPSRPGSLTGP
ncbi:cold-responsive protein kinase 1 [Selaginella moellendorffii]|uniref:cold-responsive protein kinase 1 n=1 Tax=Selaginella moellendorffii TaxID=88036 RepID=UPI000D1CBC4E|nr:cold-responsive protein kinase 1 [Selaginella moellendorffii]XP_024540306.1 cold-responsive protein kinase 1 [Selaginella moellendorffii]|eukprot:XP_024540304.1 cold-responsive protein kinase 1 [Selaginella moellendorffii]